MITMTTNKTFIERLVREAQLAFDAAEALKAAREAEAAEDPAVQKSRRQRAASTLQKMRRLHKPAAATAVVISFADIRAAQSKPVAPKSDANRLRASPQALAATVDQAGRAGAAEVGTPAPAQETEEVPVCSIELPQGTAEFILVGSEMRARIPGVVDERLILGDREIELDQIAPGYYALRGLRLRDFNALRRKVTDA
jgi:hypothetical protein